MSQDWSSRLRAGYRDSPRGSKRPVRLPDARIMPVTGEGNHATIELTRAALVGNMQENGSAFEGWSLALRYWCNATVSLRWRPPVFDPSPEAAKKSKSEARHYARFLYRVDRFKSLFPKWFDIDPSEPFDLEHELFSRAPVLNLAGERGAAAAKEFTAEAMPSPEYELESRLLRDPEFDRHFGFGSAAQKDRQFPVGLFASTVSRETAIFPGGKGAIDLVCLDDRHLWLFELKANKNIPIGTVTELIFYTSVIRDARIGRFNFEGREGGHLVKPDDVSRLDAITGVMLGNDLHPLLSDPGLLKLLNDAAVLHWNIPVKAPKVSFRADRITNEISREKPRVPRHEPLIFERRG